MATYTQIEEIRRWMINFCGRFLAEFDTLNGDEPTAVIENIRVHALAMHEKGLDIIKLLDKLLIEKKRDEFTDG